MTFMLWLVKQGLLKDTFRHGPLSRIQVVINMPYALYCLARQGCRIKAAETAAALYKNITR